MFAACFPQQLISIFGAANESSYYTSFAIQAFRTYLCMIVLACVNKIPDERFTLSEMYGFEAELQVRHPGNNNVRAKIRQQLQLLRDRGLLEFEGRGVYVKKVRG